MNLNTEKQKLADRTGQKEKRMGGGGVGASSRLGSANDVSSREPPPDTSTSWAAQLCRPRGWR